MIPLKLTLHNFLSYTSPSPINFIPWEIAVILGENGAGKSSILEALTWAIWEKTRASSSDDLIHQGTQEMWVDLTFEHEGQFYRIFRRRDRKKTGITTLQFQIKEKKSKDIFGDAWKTISEATLRATQEKIIDVLKLPYEIFVNTSYLRQNKADEFTIKTPAERKKVLGEILGIEEWRKLEEKAKLKMKTIENQLEIINFQIEDLKTQTAVKVTLTQEFNLAQKEKEKAQKNLAALEKKFQKIDFQKRKKEIVEEKINNLRENLLIIQENLKRLKGEKEENNLAEKKFAQIISNKELINKNFQKLKSLKKQLENADILHEKYQKFKEKLIYFDHQKEDLLIKIAKIQKIATCPTCLRTMTKKESASIIQFLKSNYQKNVLPKRNEIITEIIKIAYNPEFREKLRRNLKLLDGAEEDLRNLEVAETNIRNSKKNNQKIEENIDKYLSQRKEIILQGQKLQMEAKSLQKIIPLWQKMETEIIETRNALLKSEGKLGALSEAMEKIEKQEQDLKNKEKQVNQLIIDRGVMSQLVEAFGKNGIQTMIIEQALPAIEEKANLILKKASGDRMTLKFLTKRIKKTATEEMIETLEIKITDEQGERDYEMFSGGEAFRINFAIRVALSQFLAARAGIHLKFLVIDEGFGTLDASGREDLIQVINSIREDFSKIIIITHIQELKDIFPFQILITKTIDGSQIETIV